jgi:hypothetical protein
MTQLELARLRHMARGAGQVRDYLLLAAGAEGTERIQLIAEAGSHLGVLNAAFARLLHRATGQATGPEIAVAR